MLPQEHSCVRINSIIRTAVAVTIIVIAKCAYADEPCRVLRGRAHLYAGDGQLRILEVGTHHEYEPDDSSRDMVVNWLDAGITDTDRAKYASAPSMVYLFADFLVCPTEPFRKGSVQKAEIKSATHRRYAKTSE